MDSVRGKVKAVLANVAPTASAVRALPTRIALPAVPMVDAAPMVIAPFHRAAKRAAAMATASNEDRPARKNRLHSSA